MTVIPYEAVSKMFDLLEERLTDEMADAKLKMAICKEPRLRWQLITLYMLRKRFEQLKVEIEPKEERPV